MIALCFNTNSDSFEDPEEIIRVFNQAKKKAYEEFSNHEIISSIKKILDIDGNNIGSLIYDRNKSIEEYFKPALIIEDELS
jgi:hypothetical protein